ncbi:MAG: hypothetical protein CM15mP84_03520 [Cellvibrionales bacterium]|nr:MAG: hypothetical protein CM15mP84_03520 [Cellvibrionales bacterium]
MALLHCAQPGEKPDGAASDAILAKLANETWGMTVPG